MNFETFTLSVKGWAEARGIYQHSTVSAQLLKGGSELGELCDAIVKGETDKVKDGIGDTAVCLINANTMLKTGSDLLMSLEVKENLELAGANDPHRLVGAVMRGLGGALMVQPDYSHEWIQGALNELRAVAKSLDFDFGECCQMAWDEIKDRKGRMVPGGAFIKED